MIVSLVSWNGITRVTSGLEQYQKFVGVTTVSNRLQADMLLAQMNVKDFIITGNQQSIIKSSDYLDKVERSLAQAKNESHSPEHIEKMDMISREVVRYKGAIETIVSLKKRRKQIFKEELGTIGSQIAKDLAAIMDTAHNDQDEVSTYLAGMARRNLLLGRIYVFNYVEYGNQDVADKAREEFSQFDNFTRQMTILLQDESGRETAKRNRAASLQV